MNSAAGTSSKNGDYGFADMDDLLIPEVIWEEDDQDQGDAPSLELEEEIDDDDDDEEQQQQQIIARPSVGRPSNLIRPPIPVLRIKRESLPGPPKSRSDFFKTDVNGDFICPHERCDYRSTYLTCIKRHYEVKHERKQWKCPKCNEKMLAWPARIVNHRKHCNGPHSEPNVQPTKPAQVKPAAAGSPCKFKLPHYQEVPDMQKMGTKYMCPYPGCDYASFPGVVKSHYNVLHLNLRWPCPICKKQFLAWPAQIRNHYLRCKMATLRNTSKRTGTAPSTEDELPSDSPPDSPLSTGSQDLSSYTMTITPPSQNGSARAAKQFQYASSLIPASTPKQQTSRMGNRMQPSASSSKGSSINRLALLESADFEYDDFESIFHTDASFEEGTSQNNTAESEEEEEEDDDSIMFEDDFLEKYGSRTEQNDNSEGLIRVKEEPLDILETDALSALAFDPQTSGHGSSNSFRDIFAAAMVNRNGRQLSTFTDLRKKFSSQQIERAVDELRKKWTKNKQWIFLRFIRHQKMGSSTGKQYFVCKERGCEGDRYSKISDLVLHVMEDHFRGLRPFACTEDGCNDSFYFAPQLAQHIRNEHNREKDQYCEIEDCEFTTYSKMKLAEHYRAYHGIDRPFQCPDPDCGRFYKSHHDVKKHYQDCHPVGDPWVCPNCATTLFRRGSIQKHERSCGKIPFYQCRFSGCIKRFTQTPGRNDHERIFHGRGPPSFCSSCFQPYYYFTQHGIRGHINLKCPGAKIIHVDPKLQKRAVNENELWTDFFITRTATTKASSNPFRSLTSGPIWCGKIDLTSNTVPAEEWEQAKRAAVGAVIIGRYERGLPRLASYEWPKTLEFYVLPQDEVPQDARKWKGLFVRFTMTPALNAVKMTLKKGFLGCFPLGAKGPLDPDAKYLVMEYKKWKVNKTKQWFGFLIEEDEHRRKVRSLLRNQVVAQLQMNAPEGGNGEEGELEEEEEEEIIEGEIEGGEEEEDMALIAPQEDDE